MLRPIQVGGLRGSGGWSLKGGEGIYPITRTSVTPQPIHAIATSVEIQYTGCLKQGDSEAGGFEAFQVVGVLFINLKLTLSGVHMRVNLGRVLAHLNKHQDAIFEGW